MACPHCGSEVVRADRSLGGRLVCGRCGRALQGRQGQGRRPQRRRRRPGKAWLLLALLLATTALVITQRRLSGASTLPCWLDGGAGWIDRLDAALDGRRPLSDLPGPAGAGRCARDADQWQVPAPGDRGGR